MAAPGLYKRVMGRMPLGLGMNLMRDVTVFLGSDDASAELSSSHWPLERCSLNITHNAQQFFKLLMQPAAEHFHNKHLDWAVISVDSRVGPHPRVTSGAGYLGFL